MALRESEESTFEPYYNKHIPHQESVIVVTSFFLFFFFFSGGMNSKHSGSRE